MGKLEKHDVFPDSGVGWALQICIKSCHLYAIQYSFIASLPKAAAWVLLFGVKESCRAELSCPTHSSVAVHEPRARSVSVSHRVLSRVPLLLRLREDEDKKYVPVNLKLH